MRTAIYVHQPSIIVIQAKDPRDAKARLSRYSDPVDQAAVGTHKLEPGIYLIVSSGEMDVNVSTVDIQVVRNDKDTWPDPKANVVALESGASAESVKEFFRVAKDLSVDG